jgi:hypothetical protein
MDRHHPLDVPAQPSEPIQVTDVRKHVQIFENGLVREVLTSNVVINPMDRQSKIKNTKSVALVRK